MKWRAAVLVFGLAATVPAGCGEPAAQESAGVASAQHRVDPDTGGVPHDPVATAPSAAFERIRDGIAGRGEQGAQAAWSAGRPVFLVFAASW